MTKSLSKGSRISGSKVYTLDHYFEVLDGNSFFPFGIED